MGAPSDVTAPASDAEDDMMQFQDPGTSAQTETEPYDGISLEEALNALTADDAEIRARAADALLDVPAGGSVSGQRGTPWAYAVVASGAVIPLLHLVQRVRRDGRDGLQPKPFEQCPENTEAVVAGGDAALLVLAEIANAAASILAEEGWEVGYDEDTERPIFVDENSGMSQSTVPQLDSMNGDWVTGVMIETLTLIQPLDVDQHTHEPRWPVRVLHHIGCYENITTTLSVLDIAVEEGDGHERTRILVKGPWRGSQADVDGETDPNEPPGVALDSWRDATQFAALVLGLQGSTARVAATGGTSNDKVTVTKEPSGPIRVLVLGLRCGAVPAFLRKMCPKISVDVVEPTAAVATVARKFFQADFVEENVSDSTPEGFESRIRKNTNENGRYRVWTGVDCRTFLGKLPKDTKFDAVLGDLPDLETYSYTAFFPELSTVLQAKCTVALASSVSPSARRLFHKACAGAAQVFGLEKTSAACDPDEDPDEEFDSEEDASRPKKRAKPGTVIEVLCQLFQPARGRAGVIVASVGAAEAPQAWSTYAEAAHELTAAGVIGSHSPFAVDVAERVVRDNEYAWYVSYKAAEEDNGDTMAQSAERAANALALAKSNSAGNDAWDVFGDDDEPLRRNVGDKNYWGNVLGTVVCAGPVEYTDVSLAPINYDEQARLVTDEGYVWDAPAVPKMLTSLLEQAVQNAVKNGWPPAVAFLSDAAWMATGVLWRRAEQLLKSDGNLTEVVVLEPSLAAFALDPSADKAGRRYVGNNFGVPHRDYKTKDVRVGEEASTKDKKQKAPPSVLSVWLPLVDITPRNGCMYVVPCTSDFHDEQTPPGFDKSGAVALAPAEAGSLMAWAGDTIHWGTACAQKLRKNEKPRVSLAFVFRKRDAKCDARGEALTKQECCEGTGLTLARRLEVVKHALTCFEHWYGDTREMREKLTPT